MRPHKHVAPLAQDVDGERYPQVLGIALARLRGAWGDTPVVATAELDRVSLAWWDDPAGRWRTLERPHEPLRASGGLEMLLASNGTPALALAASSDAVFLLYKRERAEGDRLRTSLTVDRFVPQDGAGGRRLVLAESRPLFTVSASFDSHLGNGVWAGFDDKRRELLVVFQARWREGLQRGFPWSLVLQRVAVGANGLQPGPRQRLAEGGFDFDVRRGGDTLWAVHRSQAAALNFPLLSTAGAGLALGSGSAQDAFFPPLELLRLELGGGAPQREALPGGEHPRIQHLEPLLVTFERPHDTRAQLVTPIVPLPPARPRFAWREGGTDLVGWLRDAAGTARGVLLTHEGPTWPRPLAPLAAGGRLFFEEQGLVGHGGAFDVLAAPLVGLVAGRKGYTLDLLHHRAQRALLRTRLEIGVSGGLITVDERRFEVWDIGHEQIGDPAAQRPPAGAENTQFEPLADRVPGVPGVAVLAPVPLDNTIGGFVVVDRSSPRPELFAYTDLGDGGLRVQFAPDLLDLPPPPPVGDEKVLRPDQVPGPPIPGDLWVVMEAADWVDARLPGYSVGALRGVDRSLGAALERSLDTLLEGLEIALGDQAPAPADGITDDQFDAVDRFRAGLAAPLERTLADSAGVPLTLRLAPGSLLRTLSLAATAEGAGVAAPVVWSLLPLGGLPALPAGAVVPGPGPFGTAVRADGNPATLVFPAAGRHRLSLFLGSGAAQRSAFTDLEVDALVRDGVWALHEGVARSPDYRIGDLDINVLQYALGFRATQDGVHERLRVGFESSRNTQWRFRAGSDGRQGVIDYGARLSLRTQDMALVGLPGAVFAVDAFSIEFSYARPFSPGLLMRDSRSRDPIRGDAIADHPQEAVRRTDAAAHAAIGAKPCGNADTPQHAVNVVMSTRLPLVATSVAVTALAVLGATVLVALLLALSVSLAAAIAAGIAGVAVAVALAATIAGLLIFAAPRAAEAFVRQRVEEQFQGEMPMLKRLNDAAFLRYAGEGLGEALARRAVRRGRDLGLPIAPPGNAEAELGIDRFRGQLFQMVFVSEGRCQVLLRPPR